MLIWDSVNMKIFNVHKYKHQHLPLVLYSNSYTILTLNKFLLGRGNYHNKDLTQMNTATLKNNIKQLKMIGREELNKAG